MKTGFEDPISVKSEKPSKKPIAGKDSPWDFRCPSYDERSSCFVRAGTDYGVGKRQSVGTEKPTKSYSVPVGRVETLRIDEV